MNCNWNIINKDRRKVNITNKMME